MIEIVYISAGVAAVAAGWMIYKFVLSGRAQPLEQVRVETLALEDIIRWFKLPEHAELMRKDKALVPVLMRGAEASKYASDLSGTKNSGCVQAVFNKDKGTIEKGRVIVFSTMDESLAKQFGSKDMIVFS